MTAKKITKVLFSHFLALTLLSTATHAVFAQTDYVYEGDVVGLGWILIIVQNILGIALRLIGVASLVMLAFGSFRMISSSGDPKGVEAGKKTISFAIGGLVVAALAFFLFQLIADITGVEGILTVDIPTLSP